MALLQKTYHADQSMLSPDYVELDGRSVRDRLDFAARFMSKINFYDKNNVKSGSWNPFFLKDPVILLATISKTDYEPIYGAYQRTFEAIQKASQSDETRINPLINQLFQICSSLFKKLNEWVSYMSRDTTDYELKDYILLKIKEGVSADLWGLLRLQDQLAASKVKSQKYLDIIPVRREEFDHFDDVWTENVRQKSYLSVLGLKEDVDVLSLDTTTLIEAIGNVGNRLFGFFVKVVKEASAGFEAQLEKPNQYPDTALFITFTQLMEVYKEEINKLSKKHLDFYYKRILVQNELGASPDKSFVVIKLAKGATPLTLPKGTQFAAGTDALGNKIYFESTEKSELNTATITSAYTFSTINENLAKGVVSDLYLSSISSIGKVKKNKKGQVESTNLFQGLVQGTPYCATFGIASPMFYLTGGVRTLDVSFYLLNQTSAQIAERKNEFESATYSFSTAKTWWTINKKNVVCTVLEAPDLGVKCTFSLEPSDPVIAQFAKNPDGINTRWPTMKVVYDKSINVAAPPTLDKVDIKVHVAELPDLTLYSDTGKLNPKKPFTPFGSIASMNSNFMIGSAEAFSKPITNMYISLKWSGLPSNFFIYYMQYNLYLLEQLLIKFAINIKDSEALLKEAQTFAQGAGPLHNEVSALLMKMAQNAQALNSENKSWFGKFLESFSSLFDRMKPLKDDDIIPDSSSAISELTSQLFYNTAFKVSSSVIEGGRWNTTTVMRGTDPFPEAVQKKQTNNAKDTSKVAVLHDELILEDPTLFEGTMDVLEPISQFEFAFSAYQPDATIQGKALEFLPSVKSGFTKLSIENPLYGFGSEIYPKVVTSVATFNAMLITMMIKSGKPTVTLDVPNPPYVPTASTFSASYLANSSNQKTDSSATPLQLIKYGLFENEIVFDATDDKIADSQTLSGMPLFEKQTKNGTVLLGLTSVSPNNNLTLYFEQSQPCPILDFAQIKYHYQNESGWKELDITTDETNGLGNSGVVSLAIPGDIILGGGGMPATSYWLSITTKDNPKYIPDTCYFNAQAVEVERVEVNQESALLIPEGTIKSLKTVEKKVASVTQPFASFGSVEAESNSRFYERVSTRLKTKNRAVTALDFEMAIQSYAPYVFASRAMMVKNKLMVFLVKKVESAMAPNPFNPIIDYNLVLDIQNHLETIKSPFTTLSVTNWLWSTLEVDCHVKFVSSSKSENEQIDQLNESLKLYLSPWVTSETEQVSFQKGVSKSELTQYLLSLDDVYQVDDLSFTVDNQLSDKDIVTPKDAMHMFVSAATHSINKKTR